MTAEINNLNDLYSEVSRRADTAGTQINVAEVSRSNSLLFLVLSELPIEQALTLVARGIEIAKSKPV